VTSPPAPRRLAEFDAELAELTGFREQVVQKLLEVAPEHRLLTNQASWHLLGLNYHLGAIRDLYGRVSHDVGDIAAGDPTGNIIVCHSPAMQRLMFEFHAFISLARITLDQLVRFARPSFDRKGDLPRSVNELLTKWETDSPVYERLHSEIDLVRYLIDLRDCLVHQRTFATSDNTVAVEEGYPADKIPDLGIWGDRPVTRVTFRRLGGTKVAVNVILPDAIYKYRADGAQEGMLSEFTYENGYNLLGQSREFTRLCTISVAEALIDSVTDKTYYLKKRPQNPS
jgi:hypothetical protein